MYKIQSENRINKEFLVKYQDAKEQIINNMLVDFAHEMYKNKCCEITEKNVNNEVQLRVEAFVMTPKEFNEAIGMFKLIRCYTDIPESLREYIINLYSILTKEPR